MSTTVFSSSHISPSNTHNAADMTTLLSGTVEPSTTNGRCWLNMYTHKNVSCIPLPTSVAGERGNNYTRSDTCSEETSTVIAVSAVSLLLIVTLTTVTLTQCLLIIRMRRSRDRRETYAEATNSTTKTTDVPVSLNEAYALTKITTEEVTYEVVK